MVQPHSVSNREQVIDTMVGLTRLSRQASGASRGLCFPLIDGASVRWKMLRKIQ
jgi:hypothetical protein